MSSAASTLVVINTITQEITNTITVGKNPNDGNYIPVTNAGDGTVSVIRTI